MEIGRPRMVCCSQKKDSELKTVELIKSRIDLNIDYPIEVYEGNTYSLPIQYNRAIEEALKDNIDCLMLIHDDVILKEDPVPKLEKLFNRFDLVGLAGASSIELKSPALWHIMGGRFGSGHLHGMVNHWSEEHKRGFPTNFGHYPMKVVMIDGVFMALNRKVMEVMRFDEDNPARFHFYDLDFSLNCHLNGFSVGVGDVEITHISPGLREFTDEWRLGEKWFLNKYTN